MAQIVCIVVEEKLIVIIHRCQGNNLKNIYSKTPLNDYPFIKTTPLIRAAFVGPKLPFPYLMNLNNKTTPLIRPI